MKTPAVEADAGAEALFWEVKIDDSPVFTTVWNYYIRIKIFDERGRERFGKVNISFPANRKVTDVKARVIKSDGAIFELKKEDIFEQEIARAKRGVLLKSVSFAVPSLEAGAILEYAYKESALDLAIGGRPLMFQRDIPAHKITYIFKPQQRAEITKTFFNMTEPEGFKDEKGFYHITAANVPALKEEPFMPPEKEVARWLYISYFSEFHKMEPEKFWNFTAANSIAGFRLNEVLKPNRDIGKKALEITGNAVTDEEKIFRLYDFCQTKINNLDYEDSLSEEEKNKFKLKLGKIEASDSAAFTLKSLQGFSLEINELFASLAASAGYEVRYAFTGNRDEIFFSPKYTNAKLFHFAAVAVKIGGKWTYFDPAEPNVPFGMLRWSEENQAALLVGSDKFSWDKTPLSLPEKSSVKRSGNFKLSDGNALEGEIKLEYAGHPAIIIRDLLQIAPANERENYFISQAKTANGTTEVSRINIENLSDRTKTLTVFYQVRIPNYASKTGSRIFVQPNFFEYGMKPFFISSERIHPVYFDYPWSEEDNIELEFPPNYEIESAESPAPASNEIASDTVKISATGDNKIKYERKFVLGKNGKIYFSAGSYPSIKQMFDDFHKIDNLLISLKQIQ